MIWDKRQITEAQKGMGDFSFMLRRIQRPATSQPQRPNGRCSGLVILDSVPIMQRKFGIRFELAGYLGHVGLQTDKILSVLWCKPRQRKQSSQPNRKELRWNIIMKNCTAFLEMTEQKLIQNLSRSRVFVFCAAKMITLMKKSHAF